MTSQAAEAVALPRRLPAQLQLLRPPAVCACLHQATACEGLEVGQEAVKPHVVPAPGLMQPQDPV